MTAKYRSCRLVDIAAPVPNATVGGPFGSNLVGRDYVQAGVPVIRGENLSHGRWVGGEFVFVSEEKADALSANLARPGDVVFTQRGTLGQVALVPDLPYDRYVVSQSQMKLTVDEKLADARYVYYYFSSEAMKRYIRQHAIQTGVPHTNLTILRNTPVALPSLDDQWHIASVLGVLDDKIELNRRSGETLEALAHSVLNAWEQAAASQPDGWESKRLGDCGVWVSGGTPSKSEARYWGGSIPWISAKSLKDFVVTESEDRVTEEGAVSGTRRVPARSVVFVVRGMSLADEFRVGVTSREVTINQDVKAIIPASDVSGPLLGYALRRSSRDVLRLTDEASHGTKRLNTELIKALLLRLPTSEDRQRHFELFDALYLRQVSLQVESRALADLRDTLLPRLLAGELRIRDAEREVALAT